ncbi:MAG: hypothetical protein AB7K52_09050 [Phycisphaerales bacterium]
MRLTRLVILGALPALMGACAAPRPVDVRIPADQYTRAFDAAKETLRELDFSLERVDASAGVITTRTKATAGLATPWDQEQSGVGQELEELANRQTRVARVTFVPPAGTPAIGAPGWKDLRELNEPLTLRVEVSMFRRQRPGWRLETGAIRLSSRSSDPQLAARGMEPTYTVDIGDDPRLADRIARSIAQRLDLPSAREDDAR